MDDEDKHEAVRYIGAGVAAFFIVCLFVGAIMWIA